MSDCLEALFDLRWNTSRVLSSYLLRNPALVQGRSVLELGAGAGLPSIISATAGAKKVVVTDYPDQQLVENLSYNVEINIAETQLANVEVEVCHLPLSSTS